ncbi:MAG: beta-galactosidase [Myxococcales bacterium]|nr:beta-galactosidase [Myxococcales bacterium]
MRRLLSLLPRRSPRALVPPLLALALGPALFAACGSDPPPAPEATPDASAPTDGSSTPTPPEAAAPDASDAAPGPRVEVRGGELVIDGRPTLLYGGEVPYFRVRDKAFDAAKTQALWADTFAKMKAAHMNLVTTYFPWDYHAPRAGEWSFTGARDVGRFLDAACAAGMKVVAKPGPLITAEWPKGFGTFGAVPAWWKAAHPRSLIQKASGETYNFSPTGDASQTQPTYLDPDYLAAVADWYDHIVPLIKPFVASRCVVAVQVDNETNQYWANRFGDVDYSAVSIKHYQALLAKRYVTIAALNAAYGARYASFAAVTPPSAAPSDPNDNLAARDWYDAGQAYSLEYLSTLRRMLEARGLREPEVMFFTNDSPFGIPLRTVLLHDGAVKNQVGLAGADLYPKQFPTNGEIADQPFQVDYFTKLFGENGKLYTKDAAAAPRYAFGAELQGGFYSFPLGIKPNVTPEATDQLLAKAFGHGMKGGSFYVLRGGFNLDDSSYDFQGAIGPDGELRPRYEVMKRWGRLLSDHEAALSASDEVEDAVTLLQDSAYAVPQAGTMDDHPSLHANENPGVFGWLMTAGFNAKVADVARANLSGQKAALFLLPELVDDASADKLVAFHAGGGALITLLDPGSRNLAGVRSPSVQRLAALFDAQPSGSYTWPGLGLRSGEANQKLPGATGTTRTYWYEKFFTPAPGATPLVVERTQPFGADGKVIAFSRGGSGAPRALLGAHFATIFNQDAYYRADDADLDRKRALARGLMGLAGVGPAVRATGLREEVWARRSGGANPKLFLFVVSGHGAGTVHLELVDGSRLGLAAITTYEVTDALRGGPAVTRTGSELLARGLDVALPALGTTALVLTQK